MKINSLSSAKLYLIGIIVFGVTLFNLTPTTFGQKTANFNEDFSNNNESSAKFMDSEKSQENGNDRRRPTPTTSHSLQWEIAAMDGVKIFTREDAWYFVSMAELEATGFDTNSDSAKWQLFSEGVEIPIKVNIDGSIEFYGSGQNTLSTDTKVYYLVKGIDDGMRVPQIQGGNAGQNADAQSFQDTAVSADKLLYIASLLNGEAENWFGSIINLNGTNLTIASKDLDLNGQASLDVKLQGYSSVDHLVNVRINDYDLGVVSFTNRENYQQTFNVPTNELIDGENTITLQSIGSTSGISLVDSIRLIYQRKFQAVENKLNFKVPSGNTVRIGGFTESNLSLYEIADGKAKQQVLIDVENVTNTFGFSLSSSNIDREFVSVSNSNRETPWKIERNIPSTWNQSSNRAEFLIISPKEISASAEPLANRRNNISMQTKIVLTEDIADEFGYGILTPEAIREFLKHASATWRTKPQYVLLFGDSSYDMRNYLGGVGRNLIPTKLIETFDMETSSDGWLVDFDNDGIENLGIGRLPVGNVSEANKAIAKIIRYETQNLDHPMSAVLNADFLFETLNGELEDLLPQNVTSQRNERSTLGDAQMRQNILASANDNPTFVSYLGHGTIGVWSTGNVFGNAEALTLTNEKLSFYMLMTCLNGYTHNASNTSLSESLVLADNGAIAVWASSGSTYASGQIEMGQEVTELVLKTGKKKLRLGEVILTAKHLSGDWDARRTWQLMGDPTLMIE